MIIGLIQIHKTCVTGLPWSHEPGKLCKCKELVHCSMASAEPVLFLLNPRFNYGTVSP